MQRARRVAALLALASLAAPGASALAVTLHLAAHHEDDHHDKDRDHGVDLGVIWHGHSHAITSPAHDHPLLLAGTHVVPGLSTTQSVCGAWAAWRHTAHLAAVEPRVSRSYPAGLTGVGPPLRPDRLAILRI